jgi:uncharacterized membrane protein YdjX (TVP38/TMEM64 family)
MGKSPYSRRAIVPWLYVLALSLAAVAGFVVPWEIWLAEGQDALQSLRNWSDEYRGVSITLYVLIYITFTGLSLPGALFLTIFGGWLFGLINVVIVSFASSAGATIACWFSRTLFRDYVLASHGERWERFQREFARFGWVYLVAVRLNPMIPYFLINLFFGLTRMPLRQFWIVSQLAMLPITFLYVWAGAELARVETLSGLVSPRLIMVLAIVSLLPIVLRWLTTRWIPAE